MIKAFILFSVLALPASGQSFDNRFLIADAEQGDPEAQYTLAHLYLKGKGGVEPDSSQGIHWLQKAAEGEHADAPFDLAMFYLEQGEGGDSREKAYSWLMVAAEKNHGEAQFVLGLAYKSSDPVKGLEWLERAAENGHKESAATIITWCKDGVVACD